MKIKEAIEKLGDKKKTRMWVLNTEIVPNCLDFYLDILKFSAICRSFIVYTYPLAFKIKNKDQSYLFGQTQWCLEQALEVLDKYLIDHPIEHLVTENESGICMDNSFASVKAKFIDLKIKLTEQFNNAKKEFMSKEYLEDIETQYEDFKRDRLNSKHGKKSSK